jgi:hypothetical protein
MSIIFLDEPEDHDYPAAGSYLSLTYPIYDVEKIVNGLLKSPIIYYKAKDIIRASKEPVLTKQNKHVASNLAKIAAKTPLSPVLLVRDVLYKRLIIADGYHRTSAIYLYDEDAKIPCKIMNG